MDNLIPLIMKLQDAFNAVNAKNSIELPQIVVVGSQSAGKSSVLESIVGRDFLPRGTGIVTRCPLVLQLRRLQDQKAEDYAEFLHMPGFKFSDFEKVRQEINNQTTRIAGDSKNITDQPISLTIFSSRVVDLTLVDLPGITKVPIKGQAMDIEEQIRKMCLKFITPPNALILALTAANTDLANSDALKLARDVDPRGERTIGVVTKIDLMDEGTDALELLQGKIYPLKLGYFGVKGRSQKNINDNMTIAQAIQNERDFFEQHPIYCSHCDKLGVPYLSKSMNQILVNHITRCIPSLSKSINEHVSLKERELAQYDADVQFNPDDMGPLVLNLINKFSLYYGDLIEGRFVKESATEFLGGSRINYIFHNIFVKTLERIDPFENLTDSDIQTAIKNASALHPSLFVPEQAFEVLVRQQIARLLEPSLQCAHLVYEELRKIILMIQMPEVVRFYRLQSRFNDVMEGVLDQCLTPTTEMIMNLIEIENAFINTNHPDFIGANGSMLDLFQRDQPDNGSNNGQRRHHSLLDPHTAAKKVKEEIKKSETPNSKNQASWMGWMRGSQSDMRKVEEEEKQNLIEDEVIDEENVHSKLKRYSSMKSPLRATGQEKEEEGYQLLPNKAALENDSVLLPVVVLPTIPHTMRAEERTQNPRIVMETKIIQNLIQSYFNVVRKNIQDLVPKTIMQFLVLNSKQSCQGELVKEIYNTSSFNELLVEDPIIARNRENCKTTIAALRKAQEILNEAQQYKQLA